ncbi:23S rRNA (pseudouridine(1915)-N(3))-methyltransferase RlmH [Desulfonatronovibrio hydrogenovorans]|uniref:23S rRNA (pseudouridine(1915)-N(3))-methyltransferase RlmH n=1 Tax=Desulfonatronovibrio hydrogenovorans TaxID=53245 RepID=UPI00048ADAEE|nr:23S rRNA (pseudouridine(1915)-N(3))-methyltransferase RlmH [Desulfonatronovibrio hydrogenovorans]
MRGIRIIQVGKVRKGFCREALGHYLQKITPYIQVQLVTVKDARNGDRHQKMETEARAILDRLTPQDLLVVLDEQGKAMTSRKFSARLQAWDEDPGRRPCFVVGGAWGLSDTVRSKADQLMGLGPMTLPHELAAVVLLEQIYRAQTILHGHPYHH